MLVAGLLLLSVPVPNTSMWWLRLDLSNNTLYLPCPTRVLCAGLVITTITAAILLGWTSFQAEARRTMTESTATFPKWTLWLVLYAATLTALAKLINGPTGSEGATFSYILAATILTLSSVVSWCLGAMPARFWLRWVSRNVSLFLVVAAVGAMAYAVGRHYTPLAVASMSTLTGSLERATLRIIAFVLRLLVIHVVFDPKTSLIGTDKFDIYIDAGCAGWEGIVLFGTFFSIYLWFYRQEFRFPHVLLLMPIGAALLWSLNALRILALVLLGNWSESLAMGGFHSVAGWLFFTAAILAVVAASRRLKTFSKSTPALNPPPGSNPAAPYLAPLIMIIATAMVTRLFVYGFDALYPLRVVVGAGALWFYWKSTPLRWNASWMPVALGLLAFEIWIMLIRGGIAPTNGSIGIGLANLSAVQASLWIVFRLTGAILIMPLAEELAFRGYVMRKLISSDFDMVAAGHFTWLSFLGSSVLFGALHAQWWAGTLAGMIFAGAVYYRGLLSDGVIAHCVANSTVAAYALATRHWFLWQ